ncbi:class I SAM-dependent methyltransferase [Herbiconiux sp. 11R-BC]|uniref:class I SAM-dependent methyltransferase n=1 Tax=Herbiconiux sp. 11R-BC TaxID=3111637 RepID=UPI003C113FBD
MTEHPHPSPESAPADAPTHAVEFWETLYQERPQLWSGRANQVLTDVARTLAPGRALDLGSGEGGDSIWLAEQGWQVTGIDLSATALARAAGAAAARGIAEGSIRWVQADLTDWQPDGLYELVSACFLHAPAQIGFARESVLQRAATAVAPGGALLIVGHAAPPPWANAEHHHDEHLPTPAEVHEALGLDPAQWRVLASEVRSREGVGPDGGHGTLDDAVLLLERLSA